MGIFFSDAHTWDEAAVFAWASSTKSALKSPKRTNNPSHMWTNIRPHGVRKYLIICQLSPHRATKSKNYFEMHPHSGQMTDRHCGLINEKIKIFENWSDMWIKINPLCGLTKSYGKTPNPQSG
jgi:hypothetical protein